MRSGGSRTLKKSGASLITKMKDKLIILGYNYTKASTTLFYAIDDLPGVIQVNKVIILNWCCCSLSIDCDCFVLVVISDSTWWSAVDHHLNPIAFPYITQKYT